MSNRQAKLIPLAPSSANSSCNQVPLSAKDWDTIQHDLAQPLNNLLEWVWLVEKSDPDGTGLLSESMRRSAGQASRQVLWAWRLVGALVRLEAAADGQRWDRVAIRHELRRLLQPYLSPEVGCDLDTPSRLPPLWTDRMLLLTILDYGLHQAASHSYPLSRIAVEISTDLQNFQINITAFYRLPMESNAPPKPTPAPVQSWFALANRCLSHYSSCVYWESANSHIRLRLYLARKRLFIRHPK
ncbi:MAG: hypothetical protein M1330_01475 [Armatimonadetes bacterium]|nr:hypothetical protein [Armatimonadota bacterium]